MNNPQRNNGMSPSDSLNKQNLGMSDIGHKLGWSVRALDVSKLVAADVNDSRPARAGDVFLGQVTDVKNHSRLHLADCRYSRLFEGDLFVGVLGTRYATDAFHAPTIDIANLHLLANAGICGTVESRHSSTKSPTKVRLLKNLASLDGSVVNLRDQLFQPKKAPQSFDVPIVLGVGSGMNAGKTTVVSSTSQAIANSGLRVATLKLTGTASHRDLHEYCATRAVYVRDFSDYGFPSTYLLDEKELLSLFETMIADALDASPDIILIEVADGVYQRETQMLLRSSFVANRVMGIVGAVTCSMSAVALVDELNKLGYENLVLSGKVTNAPMYVAELEKRLNVPLFGCLNQADALADAVLSWCKPVPDLLLDLHSKPPNGELSAILPEMLG